MKKLLLIFVALMLAGCVAVPVYDDAYYHPYYGPYPYGYVGPDVNFFIPGFYGGYGFHGGHGFRGGYGFRGGHGFRGGGHWGGGR